MHMTNSKSKGRGAADACVHVYAPLRSQRQHFEEVLKDIDKNLKVRKTHGVFKRKKRLMCKKLRKLSNPVYRYLPLVRLQNIAISVIIIPDIAISDNFQGYSI